MAEFAIVYSKEGWSAFRDSLLKIKKEEMACIVNFINKNDDRQIHDDGSYLLIYKHVETHLNPDFNIFMCHTHSFVPMDNWLSTLIFEDYSIWTEGEFFSNPFDLKIKQVISYNMNNSYKDPLTKTNVSTSVVVNDHTCVSCGNNRCSKIEKSCWKCGYPI